MSAERVLQEGDEVRCERCACLMGWRGKRIKDRLREGWEIRTAGAPRPDAACACRCHAPWRFLNQIPVEAAKS